MSSFINKYVSVMLKPIQFNLGRIVCEKVSNSSLKWENVCAMKPLYLFALLSSFVAGSTNFEKQTVVHDLEDDIRSLKEIVLNLNEEIQKLRVAQTEESGKVNALERKIRELKYLDESNKRQKLLTKASGSMTRTCRDLMNSDPTLDEGMYYIDPDGWNVGDQPINVYCTKEGYTMIQHDSGSRTNVGHCFDPGCYSRPINYNASTRQMKALMTLSSDCYQSVQYFCYDAVFAFGDIQYAWWNDRNGEARYYWSGNNATTHTCTCGLSGDCIDRNLKCNCDSAAPAFLSDQGIITSMEHLPVTRLNFGRTSAPSSSGEHLLGQLVCYGSKEQSMPNHKPGSCADLWLAGNTISGLYLIQPEGAITVFTVFCDMSKLPDDPGQQTLIGTTDVKLSPIYFYVGRETNYSTIQSTIPFERAFVNTGNAMKLETGLFTAPKKGIYSFSATYRGCKGSDPAARVYLFVNTLLLASADALECDTAGIQVVVELQVNDVVKLHLRHGYLVDVPDHYYTQFTGILLQEL